MMRIAISPHGRQQISVILTITLCVAANVVYDALTLGVHPGKWFFLVFFALALAGLAFFYRDPERKTTDQEDVLVAPADGKVTDIATVEESEFLQGPALRIGIFLSVFDVHVNRAPCAGEVRYVRFHPGRFINAMKSEEASMHNQANSLGLDCPQHPAQKVLVKQITGAIARRIVCTCKPDDWLEAGQRIGMIRMGSRTELFIPHHEAAQIVVKKGDVVRAGQTIMVKYPLPLVVQSIDDATSTTDTNPSCPENSN